MARKRNQQEIARWWLPIFAGTSAAVVLVVGMYLVSETPAWSLGTTIGYSRPDAASTTATVVTPVPTLDTQAYNIKLLQLAHVATSSPWYDAFLNDTTPSTTIKKPLWPIHTTYPNAGAILPFNRIVAYYGNFYSTAMGVLGEYPPDEMLAHLKAAVQEWQAADPSTPVIPAIHYIVVTAQGSPGKDGMYRARMPDDQIDKALALAAQVHGLVFLDFQVGLSTVQKELPQYEKYLAMPNVEVGIDPEFSMKDGTPPGREIGTYSASDVNWVANYLATIVQQNHLAPKILVVHRFTEDMVTGYQNIKPLPEVQIVMDMDGWGFPAKKVNTYERVIEPEPVQFTGFKLFYKADLQAPDKRLMTPQEVLSLTPAPIYIQYQ
ncbi:MAG TPA: hypothetical protein VMU25_03510 [Candidatus Paceibacterota bacterium]|nr:hypothetical protein [Candidatus Paceibacterota bacterium]